MRLTNSDRDAFVQSALDDVPTVDYVEQIRKAAVEYALSSMTDAVRDTYKTNPDWINTEFLHINGAGGVKVPCKSGCRWSMEKEIDEHTKDLYKLYKTQTDTLCDLELKLRGVIGGCSTLKQALETLPEFAKYLPQDRDGKIIRSMPAIANLVSDMMEAGWPKGEKK